MRPPTRIEREIVADVIVRSMQLIGSTDDIWRHPAALRVLGTMRLAIRAIDLLYRRGKALGNTRVRAAMASIPRLDAEDPPFMAEDTVRHLLEDAKARAYWDSLMPDLRFPHSCPRCGSAAFIGYIRVSCKVCGDY